MLRRIASAIGLKKKATGATASEVVALRAILQGTDPRLNSLALQLEQASEVIREYPQPDEFRVRPAWTFDNLTFPLEVDRIESKAIVASDDLSGRELGFRAVVVRSGFLFALEGRTIDGGEWPRDWKLTRSQILDSPEPLITLPSLEEQRAFQREARNQLKAWVGVAVPKRFDLFPPATEAALAAAQDRIGIRFPSGFARFLSITDGIEAPDLRLFGHRDLYRLDEVESMPLAIGLDSDDLDDFVIAVSPTGSDENVYRIDIHERTARSQVMSPEFRGYLETAFANRKLP